jgi:hypothetical protein
MAYSIGAPFYQVISPPRIPLQVRGAMNRVDACHLAGDARHEPLTISDHTPTLML